MSIESTQHISRSYAEVWAMEILARKLTEIKNMTDGDLVDFIYDNTRNTNRFDNFRIDEDGIR